MYKQDKTLDNKLILPWDWVGSFNEDVKKTFKKQIESLISAYQNDDGKLPRLFSDKLTEIEGAWKRKRK